MYFNNVLTLTFSIKASAELDSGSEEAISF